MNGMCEELKLKITRLHDWFVIYSPELFEEFERILHTCEEWLHKPKSIKKTRLICTPSSSSHSRITEDTKTPGNCDESVKPSSDDLVKALEKKPDKHLH